MASKKHVHKYMRQQLKFVRIWRCATPDCNHWMPPHMEDIIIGRSSICWGCGEKFTLDEAALEDDMPMCFTCRQPAAIVETPFGDISIIDQFLKEKEKVAK